MESLLYDIASTFGLDDPPQSNEIVVWDGFDQLEKEDAVKFYTGKTWSDVLLHLHGLKDESVFGAAYYLEEWSVLSRVALPYYLRAHLEYLVDSDLEPDGQFISSLLEQLYQVIYMYKGSPFSSVQTQLLQKVAHSIAEALEGQEYYGDWKNSDLKAQVVRFQDELHTHGQ